jgi:hypothetical protein
LKMGQSFCSKRFIEQIKVSKIKCFLMHLCLGLDSQAFVFWARKSSKGLNQF